jgi:hypothetical protein
MAVSSCATVWIVVIHLGHQHVARLQSSQAAVSRAKTATDSHARFVGECLQRYGRQRGEATYAAGADGSCQGRGRSANRPCWALVWLPQYCSPPSSSSVTQFATPKGTHLFDGRWLKGCGKMSAFQCSLSRAQKTAITAFSASACKASQRIRLLRHALCTTLKGEATIHSKVVRRARSTADRFSNTTTS